MKEHIIINKDRTVVVPDSVRKIGIQYDHKVNTLTFDCPRYADDNQSIDLSRMAIYINFSRNDKTKGSVAATNVFVDPDDPEIIHFDFVITRSVTLVNGSIICLVCAKSTDAEGVEVNHWNSELFNKLSVGEGLEAEELTEEEIDYITSLLQEINTTRAEVADMDTRVEDLEFNQEKQGVVSEVDLEAMTWAEGSYITGSGTIGSSSGYGISEPVTLPKMSTLILDATGYQSDVAMIAKSDHTPLVTSVDGKTHYEYYTDEEIQVYISCKTTEAKSAKIVRNVSETLSDLERENSELKSEIDQLKQAGTGSGSGVTVAQSNSLWAIIQKAAFAEALTDEELNDFKTAWGITTENIPATGITLDKSTLSFTDSATQTLIATIEPSNSTDKVTWKSSDAGIATVSGGVVTPISNGSCTITAKAGSYSATCAVTVDIAEEGQVTLTSISATYTGGDVAVGTDLTDLIGITVTGIYSDGSTSAITGYTLSGTIAEGSNTITVSYGGKTTTFTVTGVVESGGGEVTAEFPTDGLVAYFDFRNTTPEINTKQGFTKFNANQGNGCLFTWSASAFTSSDDYGVKRMARSFMFDKDGGTNQSELGTSFTMLFKGYNVVNGAFVSNDHTGVSNVSVFLSKPKYNTSSGQLQVGQENIGNTQWSGYIDAYFVADGEVFKVYINGELVKTYTGTDYEDFVSWYSKVTTIVFGGGNYQTALALYGKALSEVEIVEARAFLQTLEVA